MLYFAAGIGFLDSTTTTVMRSMIISVVPVTEIGKVFCVVEFFKAILALVGPSIYGFLYEKTLRTVPGAFLWLSSACKCVVFVVGLIVYFELSKRDNREKREKYSHKKDDVPIINDKIEEELHWIQKKGFIEERRSSFSPADMGDTEMVSSPCQVLHEHTHNANQKNSNNTP